ncbi:MAG: glutathionylspermidine synthase family protein [Bacteroidota bacterium]
MVDRIIDLPDRAEDNIKAEGFGWFLEADNHDYLTTDAILVHKEELQDFKSASETCFDLYRKALDHVVQHNLWSRLDIPENIIPLIKHDLKRELPHVCGRLDWAGGMESIPLKLIEFNADTSAIMPESAYFQSWMYEAVRLQFKGQYNYLIHDLAQVFRDLRQQFPDLPATLLLCSLGYEEDRLNLRVIEEAAIAANFAVDYADLEEVVFGEDGVFLENEEGYVQYHFLYKLVPWEFIMFEEPELMDILVRLSLEHDLVVLNPAYSIAFQAKHMLSILYELFPDHPLLLPTYDEATPLQGKQYVRKVNFGRLGENVAVIDASGGVIAETDGDFGDFSTICQAFAPMYADEDGDIYQASMYLVDGKASCLSFRRRDDLIIDDDSEFVTHVLFE